MEMSMVNASKTVLIAGVGNIGSFAVSLIARDPLVKKIIMVDYDEVEKKNLGCQDFCTRDLGMKKSEVAARKLRNFRPDLDIEAICDRIQSLPMGKLRCDVILGCFDNNLARQQISETAFMLGIPYIDAGVNADGDSLLARVSIYIPGAGAPCHQCGWSKMHYEQLEQEYPCGNGTTTAATNSPSFLGAQAAVVQAAECAKVLIGQADRIAANRQIMFDMSFNKYYVTGLIHNPNCRFDHNILEVEMLDRGPYEIKIGWAMKLGGMGHGSTGALELLGGRAFFRGSYHCDRCGYIEEVFAVTALFPERNCRRCGVKNEVESLELVPRLEAGRHPDLLLKQSLGDIGFRAGDVFIIDKGNTGKMYFEIGGLK